jgi:hypothetical protein
MEFGPTRSRSRTGVVDVAFCLIFFQLSHIRFRRPVKAIRRQIQRKPIQKPIETGFFSQNRVLAHRSHVSVSPSHPLSQAVSRFDEVIEGNRTHMQGNWSKTLTKKCFFGHRRREIRLMSHVSCHVSRSAVV